MRVIDRSPRRVSIIIAASAFLLGTVVSPWLPSTTSLLLCLGLVLFGLALVAGRYWCLVALGAVAISTGYVLAIHTIDRNHLNGPVKYDGPATIISIASAKPPRQTVVVQLKTGEYRGQLVRLMTYDFPCDMGETCAIVMTVQPSVYASDVAKGIIGTSRNAIIGAPIAPAGPLARLRQRIVDVLGASLPEPHASLATGLLTGVSPAFDPRFKTDLQRTGTTHIVAVSGYNLTIVALFLLRLGQRRSRWLGFGLAAVSIMAYVIIAGFSASIGRGAIVAFLSLVPKITGRIVHRVPLVLLAAVGLSIINPLTLAYDLSGQLSFLGFLAVLFIADPLGRLFQRLPPLIAPSIAETLAAELLTLPLIVFRFGIVSFIAPLVNGVILVFVPMAMFVSFVQTVIALISIPLGQFTAWITYPILDLIVRPIEFASRQPWAAATVQPLPAWALAVSYVGVAATAVGILYWHRHAEAVA